MSLEFTNTDEHREILSCDDRTDARNTPGRGGIDRQHPGMGMRADSQGGVKQTRLRGISRVTGRPGYFLPGFLSQNFFSDGRGDFGSLLSSL